MIDTYLAYPLLCYMLLNYCLNAVEAHFGTWCSNKFYLQAWMVDG